jgi:hypothetical protein
MNGDVTAHRSPHDVHRLFERRLDPARQQARDIGERQRQRRSFREESIAPEPDEVDGDDEMLGRQRFDVAAPPVRRSAQPVDQYDRRPASRARLPEPVRRKLDLAR